MKVNEYAQSVSLAQFPSSTGKVMDATAGVVAAGAVVGASDFRGQALSRKTNRTSCRAFMAMTLTGADAAVPAGNSP